MVKFYNYYPAKDGSKVWRASPHEITPRHSIYIEQTQKMLNEKQESGELENSAYLQAFNSYPLLVAGLRLIEVAECEDIPEDVETLEYKPIHINTPKPEYHPLPFETFLDMPESCVIQFLEVVYSMNPSRAMEYEWLKKTQEIIRQNMNAALNTSTSNIPNNAPQSEKG